MHRTTVVTKGLTQAAVRYFALLLLLVLSACATPMTSGAHCSADPTLFTAQLQFAWHPAGAVDLIDESGYVSPGIVAQLQRRAARELNLSGGVG